MDDRFIPILRVRDASIVAARAGSLLYLRVHHVDPLAAEFGATVEEAP